MVDALWTSKTLRHDSNIEFQPSFERIQKLGPECFQFLIWFLEALEVQMTHYPDDLRRVNSMVGIDAAKSALVGKLLRTGVIASALSGAGISFVGKSFLREVRVSSSYKGLSMNLCEMLGKKFVIHNSELSFDFCC